MAENVPAMAKVILQELPVLFGIASIENSFDKVAVIEMLPSEQIEDKETNLQIIAKQLLPKLYFDEAERAGY